MNKNGQAAMIFMLFAMFMMFGIAYLIIDGFNTGMAIVNVKEGGTSIIMVFYFMAFIAKLVVFITFAGELKKKLF